MRKVNQILIATAFIVATSISLLYAHSGRTDANGGHYNRKTGEYHYHNSGRSSSSSPSPRSTYSPPQRPISKRPTRSITPPKASTQDNSSTLSQEKKKPIRITENHWQVALNKKVYHGKIEAPVSSGRVDIMTDDYVIEVDKISKYAEGFEQVIKYARATGHEPVLALYIDGERNGYELLQKADALCKTKGVSLVLINSVVSVNDLISLVTFADSSSSMTSESGVKLSYWINTSSGTRHNSSCRYFKNTKSGRACSKSEGRACGICGG